MKDKSYKTLLSLIAMSVLTGVVVGLICSLFGQVLIYLTHVRESHHGLILLLAPAGMLFTYFFQKYGRTATQGMSLVFDVGHKKATKIPLRLIPFVVSGTWLTHLFGGSVGREGVAVQLGATIANQWQKYDPTIFDRKVLVTTGIAAGFAGLYQTPIAALFFSLELLVSGQIYYPALLSAGIAAVTASQVSHWSGLEKFSVYLAQGWDWTSKNALLLLVSGILFGLVGWLFTLCLKYIKQTVNRYFANPVVKAGVIGLVVSIFAFILWSGRYSGLGTNLIEASFAQEVIYPTDWVLKLLLTVLTIAGGYQGGEVTPLFAIGSTFGVVLAHLFGLPIELMAALGYVSVFSSATNTWLAPIFISAEVFGYEHLPIFILVCTVAYLCNNNQSIYPKQQLYFDEVMS